MGFFHNLVIHEKIICTDDSHLYHRSEFMKRTVTDVCNDSIRSTSQKFCREFAQSASWRNSWFRMSSGIRIRKIYELSKHETNICSL